MGHRGTYSHRKTPGTLNTQSCLFKERDIQNHFPPRSLRMDMVNSLVTFVLSIASGLESNLWLLLAQRSQQE